MFEPATARRLALGGQNGRLFDLPVYRYPLPPKASRAPLNSALPMTRSATTRTASISLLLV